MHGQPGHDTRPHVRLPPCFLGMNPWVTSQLNAVSNRKLPGSLVCLAYSINVLSIDVCITRYWQTPGRLVQELNDCTVVSILTNTVYTIDIAAVLRAPLESHLMNYAPLIWTSGPYASKALYCKFIDCTDKCTRSQNITRSHESS